MIQYASALQVLGHSDRSILFDNAAQFLVASLAERAEKHISVLRPRDSLS